MDPTPDTLMEQYAADYMEKVFYFCLRKCGDPTEAEDLDTRIALAHLTPGMSPFVLRHMAEGLHGLIVEGVGIGGIPDTLVPVLTRVAESGVFLILTSQVPYGASDFTVYRAGRRIHEACGGQVVTARDIPSEAAFAAAMWAMAVSRDREDMAERFARALRGADL